MDYRPSHFTAGTITGGGSGTISFTNVERVVGGNFNASLSGNAAGQNLTGQGGADTLGGAGGVDTLWGGAGADTFIFRETGTGNADSVDLLPNTRGSCADPRCTST